MAYRWTGIAERFRWSRITLLIFIVLAYSPLPICNGLNFLHHIDVDDHILFWITLSCYAFFCGAMFLIAGVYEIDTKMFTLFLSTWTCLIVSVTIIIDLVDNLVLRANMNVTICFVLYDALDIVYLLLMNYNLYNTRYPLHLRCATLFHFVNGTIDAYYFFDILLKLGENPDNDFPFVMHFIATLINIINYLNISRFSVMKMVYIGQNLFSKALCPYEDLPPLAGAPLLNAQDTAYGTIENGTS